MYRLLSIILISLSIATTATAQYDTVRLRNFPASGYTLRQTGKHNDFAIYNPGHGEDIFSNQSNIYALLPGNITATFTVGNDNYMIVRTGDTFIVYSQLECSFYKKGDSIAKHELLGYAAYSEHNAAFVVNVQAWRSQGKGAREDKKLLWRLVE